MAEQQGIRSDVIPKIATGFCSGFSRTGGLCGAVSGAVMGIGLALGRVEPKGTVELAYKSVNRFVEGFNAKFGALTCLELTGVNLGTPEGQASYLENQVIHRCVEYAAGAAVLASKIIEETIGID